VCVCVRVCVCVSVFDQQRLTGEEIGNPIAFCVLYEERKKDQKGGGANKITHRVGRQERTLDTPLLFVDFNGFEFSFGQLIGSGFGRQ